MFDDPQYNTHHITVPKASCISCAYIEEAAKYVASGGLYHYYVTCQG